MSESDDLAKQIEALKAQVEAYKEVLKPAEDNLTNMAQEEAAARAEYEAKIASIRTAKQKIKDDIYDAQSKANTAAWDLKNKERLLELAQAEEEKAKQAAALQEQLLIPNEKWDALAMGAEWREHAKNHQIEGGKKLVQDRHVIVADPPGLGKTLTSIAACDMAEAATRETSKEHPFLGEVKERWVPTYWEYIETGKRCPSWELNQAQAEGTVREFKGHYEQYIDGAVERPVGKRILYFCPASMLKNVEAEFRMWAKHRNVTIIGGMTKAERAFVFDVMLKGRAEYVVICNYEAWRRDKGLLESLIGFDFDTIIIDEAHNIKDMSTSAYKGIAEVVQSTNPEYLFPMTGTPILNRPQELFPLLHLVAPTVFFDEKDFLYSYCEQDKDTLQWKFQAGGIDRLTQRIGKYFMRRTRDQAGVELPEKTVTIHSLERDDEKYPNQARIREQMKKNAIIMIDESQGKGIAAAAMIAVYTRLRQIETWPMGIVIKNPITKEIELQVDVEESQKIDYLIAWDDKAKEWDGLLTSVLSEERAVLFSQFKMPLHEIEARLKRMGKRAVVLDGDTPKHIREEIRVDFDNRHTPDPANAKWDIVLCNYKVGGVGMNLTAATQMVILDEEWNPGKRDQAYDRIHRIGQDKPVTIHVIRMGKTVDDWLAGIMAAKEEVVDGFNSAVGGSQDFLDAIESGLL